MFLIFAQKRRLCRIAEAVLTSTHNLCFEQKYEKSISFFLSESFQFLEVKFSIYLNMFVFYNKGTWIHLEDFPPFLLTRETIFVTSCVLACAPRPF